MIMHHHFLMESWSKLDEATQTGKQVRPRASFDDPTQREAFLMGMFNNAMLMAPRLVKEVDLSGKKHLLDLGGGPGTYAIHFCMENPNIKATVYDLPSTRPFAEKTIRQFGTGATRDTDEGKYDYEGFLSPLVIERYGQYMNKHRKQSDGNLRDSDNWQRGIPKQAYIKSGWRHFIDWWKEHRGIPTKDGIEEALCALLFNVSGYLHEHLKGEEKE